MTLLCQKYTAFKIKDDIRKFPHLCSTRHENVRDTLVKTFVAGVQRPRRHIIMCHVSFLWFYCSRYAIQGIVVSNRERQSTGYTKFWPTLPAIYIVRHRGWVSWEGGFEKVDQCYKNSLGHSLPYQRLARSLYPFM